MVRVVEGKISGGCAWGCAGSTGCAVLYCAAAGWQRTDLLGSGWAGTLGGGVKAGALTCQ